MILVYSSPHDRCHPKRPMIFRFRTFVSSGFLVAGVRALRVKFGARVCRIEVLNPKPTLRVLAHGGCPQFGVM